MGGSCSTFFKKEVKAIESLSVSDVSMTVSHGVKKLATFTNQATTLLQALQTVMPENADIGIIIATLQEVSTVLNATDSLITPAITQASITATLHNVVLNGEGQVNLNNVQKLVQNSQNICTNLRQIGVLSEDKAQAISSRLLNSSATINGLITGQQQVTASLHTLPPPTPNAAATSAFRI